MLILGFLRWFQPPVCSSASFCSLKEKTHTHIPPGKLCKMYSAASVFLVLIPATQLVGVLLLYNDWLYSEIYIYGLVWVIWLVVPCMNESDG